MQRLQSADFLHRVLGLQPAAPCEAQQPPGNRLAPALCLMGWAPFSLASLPSTRIRLGMR